MGVSVNKITKRNSTRQYLDSVYKNLYVEYSKQILELANDVASKDAHTYYKVGFQQAVICSLQVLLNARNKIINKVEENENK